MKKALSVLLLLSMLFCVFTACSSPSIDESTQSDPTSSDSAEAKPSQTVKKPSKITSSNKKPTPDTDETEDGVLKILTIGNSFSDDTMQYVYKIAESAGVESIKLGNLYIGGCTLDLHASNARANKGAYDYRTNSNDSWSTTPNYKMSDAIVSENWDFISLQQASGSSGIADTYSQLEYMIEYVHSLAPNAQLVWNMTWAYQQDTTHGEFPKYNSDQMQMYESIVSAVKGKICTSSDIKYVIPNGTAIQNARTSYVGDTLTRDGFHLSLELGRYVAGLTLFYKLTGISIESIEYMPDGIDEDLRKIAIESAMNAVASPWQVTESQYKEAPVFDPSLYDVLELNVTMLGYWNSATGRGIDTKTDNHIYFAASRLFTKEDIPVGSVIMLADGWRYRPEAWKSDGPQSSRPDTTNASKIVVTSQWWGDYTHRAFNISKTDGSSLEGLTADDIASALIIYVPKK